MKALLADDNRENRDVLSLMLEEVGAEVTVTSDGQEALDTGDDELGHQVESGNYRQCFGIY